MEDDGGEGGGLTATRRARLLLNPLIPAFAGIERCWGGWRRGKTPNLRPSK